jgi:hydroxyacylglutathione hydrolase
MATMIVERASHPQFVSNTYLVSDQEGGPAFFIDAGGPVSSLIEAAERLELTPTHVLLTHHHFDHVCEAGLLLERWPELEVLISPLERDMLAGVGEGAGAVGTLVTGTVEAGQTLQLGTLEVRPLYTPGHTGGEAVVVTGDTLFRNSVGGVRAPGHTTYTDLRDSIMGTLMELPPETIIYPGHAEASTVAQEWDLNPFIRVWRGLDPQGTEACTALGEPATLVLLTDDYDGGKKAWVRWKDGSDDIVPGSQVSRGA